MKRKLSALILVWITVIILVGAHPVRAENHFLEGSNCSYYTTKIVKGSFTYFDLGAAFDDGTFIVNNDDGNEYLKYFYFLDGTTWVQYGTYQTASSYYSSAWHGQSSGRIATQGTKYYFRFRQEFVPNISTLALCTSSDTATPTPTHTSTSTETSTPTSTPTITDTPTETSTPTTIPPTATYTRTITDTPTNTAVFTSTSTSTPTATNTPQDTATETLTPTSTVTLTPAPTFTAGPSPTPTPLYEYLFTLSSGAQVKVIRSFTYGQIAVAIVLLALLGVYLVSLFIRIPKLWR